MATRKKGSINYVDTGKVLRPTSSTKKTYYKSPKTSTTQEKASDYRWTDATRQNKAATPMKMKKTMTPKGGAVAIRKANNAANAVKTGALETSHRGERPIIEKKRMQEYIASKKPAKTTPRKKGVTK